MGGMHDLLRDEFSRLFRGDVIGPARCLLVVWDPGPPEENIEVEGVVESCRAVFEHKSDVLLVGIAQLSKLVN